MYLIKMMCTSCGIIRECLALIKGGTLLGGRCSECRKG